MRATNPLLVKLHNSGMRKMKFVFSRDDDGDHYAATEKTKRRSLSAKLLAQDQDVIMRWLNIVIQRVEQTHPVHVCSMGSTALRLCLYPETGRIIVNEIHGWHDTPWFTACVTRGGNILGPFEGQLQKFGAALNKARVQMISRLQAISPFAPALKLSDFKPLSDLRIGDPIIFDDPRPGCINRADTITGEHGHPEFPSRSSPIFPKSHGSPTGVAIGTYNGDRVRGPILTVGTKGGVTYFDLECEPLSKLDDQFNEPSHPTGGMKLRNR